MDPKLTSTLEKVRRRMTAWQAMVKLKWGLAAICGALFIAGWVDLLVRLEQAGRVGAWIPLVLLFTATVWLVWSALSRAYSHEGIAAALEPGLLPEGRHRGSSDKGQGAAVKKAASSKAHNG